MANYIVSYDLNGPTPTHQAMDKHMEKAGWTRGQILETVWYVGTSADIDAVASYVQQILSSNDSLVVVSCLGGRFQNLLIPTPNLVNAWNQNG